MSSSSTNDSNSDSSTDDESSIERDECNSRERRRLLALVSGYVFIKRNQRRQLHVPLLRAKKKKRKRRDPDVLLQESLDDGMFQREHRMSCGGQHPLEEEEGALLCWQEEETLWRQQDRVAKIVGLLEPLW